MKADPGTEQRDGCEEEEGVALGWSRHERTMRRYGASVSSQCAAADTRVSASNAVHGGVNDHPTPSLSHDIPYPFLTRALPCGRDCWQQVSTFLTSGARES